MPFEVALLVLSNAAFGCWCREDEELVLGLEEKTFLEANCNRSVSVIVSPASKSKNTV